MSHSLKVTTFSDEVQKKAINFFENHKKIEVHTFWNYLYVDATPCIFLSTKKGTPSKKGKLESSNEDFDQILGYHIAALMDYGSNELSKVSQKKNEGNPWTVSHLCGNGYTKRGMERFKSLL